MRKYSRLISVQEKRHMRAAALWFILTLLFLVGFVFWGLPALTNISSFIANMRSGPPSTKNDTIAPASPFFITEEGQTNHVSLIIEGTSEAKSTVIFSHNGNEQELSANDQSHFESEVTLVEGENIFVARAQDQQGNESQNSKSLIITLDTIAPDIAINEPTDSETVVENTVTVAGKTSEEALVWVNGKPASNRDDNNFSVTVSLTQGENTITVKAQDPAGNNQEMTITVNRSF